MSDQFVYFIQADQGGPIKIGFTSDDPQKRLSQLQTGNAARLRLLGSIKGDIAREKDFHDSLAEWRLQGEWFEAHPKVLSSIADALVVSSAEHPPVCGGPFCSFCGICKHETSVLIAGDREAYICAECSGKCARVAAEHLLKDAEAVQSATFRTLASNSTDILNPQTV